MTDKLPSYERYSRQVRLTEWGEAGQNKLFNASILMIGAGGLGCAALPYLAAAGVGTIGIIDYDRVALHNLHRQVLYKMEDIGLPKALCAADALRKLNPDISITGFNFKLSPQNCLSTIAPYDVIIDGTDNFSSRYMINDACVLAEKPLIYGAVSKFEGQVALFNWAETERSCAVNYRDLFPSPPAAGTIDNCAEAGVLGVLPGIIGVMQAAEAIKLITGIGRVLSNTLLTYNALTNQLYELALSARKDTRKLIPADATAFEKMDYDWLCGVPDTNLEINIDEFNRLMRRDDVMIIDVREPGEQPAVTEFKHIAIPLAQIAQLENLDKDTVLVFCQSGKRSLQAAEQLCRKFGSYKNIVSLAGGIAGWKKATLE